MSDMHGDHGHCPNCGADLNGGSIYEHFFKEYEGDAERAKKTAAFYGADEHHGQWGREIGIYDMEKDRTVAWQCPDCNHEWKR